MSADNGIYIVETAGPEFRVEHMTAVENLNWDKTKENFTNDPNVIINNVRDRFFTSPVFTSKSAALEYAAEQAKKCYILEYGISFVCEEVKNIKF